jgi:hypothetical protein
MYLMQASSVMGDSEYLSVEDQSLHSNSRHPSGHSPPERCALSGCSQRAGVIHPRQLYDYLEMSVLISGKRERERGER